jgi:hypothetical protein
MHRAFLSVIAILGCAGAPEPSAPKPQASTQPG